MNIRIGYGFDIHRLTEGVPFWLGGIQLAHPRGAEGHSDADVLIHSICDALLGAANMRDIGFHFANTDPAYRGIDSKILLERVMALIREKGYEVANIDSTICLEKPKVNPHIPTMIETLVRVMNLEADQLSIKATTNEKLGYIGREEGIEAHAVALLYKK